MGYGELGAEKMTEPFAICGVLGSWPGVGGPGVYTLKAGEVARTIHEIL